MRVTLSVNNREVIVRELDRDEIDVAIMGQPPRAARDRCGRVRRPSACRRRAARASAHPRAADPLADLAGETFLVREPGSGTRSSMERFFADHAFEARIGGVMNSNETIKQAVMAGMGLAFLSRHTIGLELATRRIAILDVAGLPADAPLVRRAPRRAFRESCVDRIRRVRRRGGAGAARGAEPRTGRDRALVTRACRPAATHASADSFENR